MQNSVSLLAVKDQMMTAQETMYPITMEEAESGYGYMLYSVNLKIIITKISSKLWRPVTDASFADGSLDNSISRKPWGRSDDQGYARERMD